MKLKGRKLLLQIYFVFHACGKTGQEYLSCLGFCEINGNCASAVCLSFRQTQAQANVPVISRNSDGFPVLLEVL